MGHISGATCWVIAFSVVVYGSAVGFCVVIFIISRTVLPLISVRRCCLRFTAADACKVIFLSTFVTRCANSWTGNVRFHISASVTSVFHRSVFPIYAIVLVNFLYSFVRFVIIYSLAYGISLL